MAYGDGTNWSGVASPALLGIAVDFDPVSEVKFNVGGGNTSSDVANALIDAWNKLYQGEATRPDLAKPTVRFTRGGKAVKEIYIREGDGPLKPLTYVVAVAGMMVTRVST